jgi:heme/copper-type cytochrome/quinol oxidase subunit 2
MNGALIIAWACAAAAVAVFAAMMISIATFGDRPAASAHQKTAEMLWAMIPMAIVLAAAMPAFKTMVLAGRGDIAQLAATGSPPTALPK